MSTKTIGVVGRGSWWQKVGIELRSCVFHPNSSQPGMFQTFAKFPHFLCNVSLACRSKYSVMQFFNKKISDCGLNPTLHFPFLSCSVLTRAFLALLFEEKPWPHRVCYCPYGWILLSKQWLLVPTRRAKKCGASSRHTNHCFGQ